MTKRRMNKMKTVLGTQLEGSNFDDLMMQADDGQEKLSHFDPDKLEAIMYKLAMKGRRSFYTLERKEIQEKLNFYGGVYASITKEYFNVEKYEKKLMIEREYIVEQTGFGD